MLILLRAVTYAAIFVSLVLVYLPAGVLARAGVVAPAAIGPAQIAGIVGVGVGGALGLWCVLAFVFVGRGTPAPFDPPRRLVETGPYSVVRNPMYIGAAAALASASLYLQSWTLLVFTGVFWLVAHLFVVWYEEPTLHRLFGHAYASYCERVKRWQPRFRRPRMSRDTG